MAAPAPNKSSKSQKPVSAKASVKLGATVKSESSSKSSSKGSSSKDAGAKSKPKVAKVVKPAKQRGLIMQLLTWPFRKLSQIFFADVKLKREGGNLNVKLIPKDNDPSRQRALAKSKEQLELASIALALKILLDSHPATRRVMRHLVFFETVFGASGLKATHDVPIEVLTEALKQLESLVTNWSSRDLSDLRSKMSVAIVSRSKDPFCSPGGEKVSDFNTDSRLQVDDDISHSRFMQIADEYHGREPIQAAKIAKVDIIDFAPTMPFDREELHLLSKEVSHGSMDAHGVHIPPKGVPDFAPTQPFDRELDEIKIQLMPIA